MAAERAATPKGPTPQDPLPWVPLLTLLAVFVSNQWCRALIYYVNNFEAAAGPDAAFLFANVDLGFGPAEYATLASFGFTAIFAVASLFAGRLADVYDRRVLTVGACVAWSVVTAGMAGAHSYTDLLILRSLQGLSMAATAPAAYSLIAELTPPNRIASANSIYSAGIYFGGALASLGVVLDESLGWRGTSLAVGGVSLGTALLCWLVVKDPRTATQRGSFDEQEKGGRDKTFAASTPILQMIRTEAAGLQSSLGTILTAKPVRLLLAAAGVRFCAGFGLGVWKAPFYLGKFPASADEFSYFNAVIIGVAGGLSTVLGGRVADMLAEKSTSPDEARLLVPIWGSVLAAPLLYASLSADTIEVSLSFMLLEYLAAECWVGPTIAGIYAGLPDATYRGTAQGTFSLLTAAGNLAPVLIGAMVSSKGVAGTSLLSDTSLEDAMILVICSSYLLSGALFAAGSASFKKANSSSAD